MAAAAPTSSVPNSLSVPSHSHATAPQQPPVVMHQAASGFANNHFKSAFKPLSINTGHYPLTGDASQIGSQGTYQGSSQVTKGQPQVLTNLPPQTHPSQAPVQPNGGLTQATDGAQLPFQPTFRPAPIQTGHYSLTDGAAQSGSQGVSQYANGQAQVQANPPPQAFQGALTHLAPFVSGSQMPVQPNGGFMQAASGAQHFHFSRVCKTVNPGFGQASFLPIEFLQELNAFLLSVNYPSQVVVNITAVPRMIPMHSDAANGDEKKFGQMKQDREICRFFMKAQRCKWADRCKHVHILKTPVADAAAAAPKVVKQVDLAKAQPVTQHAQQLMRTCFYFNSARGCHFGDGCKYAHIPTS